MQILFLRRGRIVGVPLLQNLLILRARSIQSHKVHIHVQLFARLDTLRHIGVSDPRDAKEDTIEGPVGDEFGSLLAREARVGEFGAVLDERRVRLDDVVLRRTVLA